MIIKNKVCTAQTTFHEAAGVTEALKQPSAAAFCVVPTCPGARPHPVTSDLLPGRRPFSEMTPKCVLVSRCGRGRDSRRTSHMRETPERAVRGLDGLHRERRFRLWSSVIHALYHAMICFEPPRPLAPSAGTPVIPILSRPPKYCTYSIQADAFKVITFKAMEPEMEPEIKSMWNIST